MVTEVVSGSEFFLQVRAYKHQSCMFEVRMYSSIPAPT
jgi:hypothetical protein